MKASQYEKEGKEKKGIAGKLALKSHHSSTVKENNINYSNGHQDYRNLVKRSEDYYRIDPVELKSVKHGQNYSYRQTNALSRQRF